LAGSVIVKRRVMIVKPALAGGCFVRISLPTLSGSQIRLLEAIAVRLLVWLLFNVAVALVPFIARAGMTLFTGRPVVWKAILSDGELFLVTAAIASGAIGELIAKRKPIRIPGVLALGCCGLCVLLTCCFYGFLRAYIDPTTLSVDAIFIVSLGMFLFTFMAGTGCIILSEVQ
jgi:hypothetical protein